MNRADEIMCGYVIGLAIFAFVLLCRELYRDYKAKRGR